MSQKSSLIYSIIIIAISIFLGLMIGRYIVPERHIEVIDYGEEFYTAQLQKNLSTIDSLESVIKVQESIVDSFLNLRNQVQVE